MPQAAAAAPADVDPAPILTVDLVTFNVPPVQFNRSGCPEKSSEPADSVPLDKFTSVPAGAAAPVFHTLSVPAVATVPPLTFSTPTAPGLAVVPPTISEPETFHVPPA